MFYNITGHTAEQLAKGRAAAEANMRKLLAQAGMEPPALRVDLAAEMRKRHGIPDPKQAGTAPQATASTVDNMRKLLARQQADASADPTLRVDIVAEMRRRVVEGRA